MHSASMSNYPAASCSTSTNFASYRAPDDYYYCYRYNASDVYPNSAHPSTTYDSPHSDSRMFVDDFETAPISPSHSVSSSASSDVAPSSPAALPKIQLLYTKLDSAPWEEMEPSPDGYDDDDDVDEDVDDADADADVVAGDETEWRRPEPPTSSVVLHHQNDVTQIGNDESSAVSVAAIRPALEKAAAALRACEFALAPYQSFHASPTTSIPPMNFPPLSPATASSSGCSSSRPSLSSSSSSSCSPITCLSPMLLSIASPPLELHQPQPRRRIPVVSLAELASCCTADGSLSDPETSHSSASVTRYTKRKRSVSPYTQSRRPSRMSRDVPCIDTTHIGTYPRRCSCPECF